MYQIRNKTAPLTFSGSFKKISHGCPTNFSQFNYKIPKTALSKSKFRISFRGPSIWNNFLQNSEKKKLSHFRFLNLNWNLNCFLLAMKLHTFYISAVSSQNPVDEKGLDDKAIVAFCESFLVSKTNINLII